ncbi:TPA: hypothetical protein NIA45_004619 [Pseudomonas aeruginosa]|nr:hypothetical protein [Pseudomonas aeruginosa]
MTPTIPSWTAPIRAIQLAGSFIAAGHQPRPEDLQTIRTAIQAARPMQVAEIFSGLAAEGCMDTEVARITGRSLRNVRALCAIWDNHEIRSMVAAGQVPVAIAHQAIEDSKLTGLPATATLQAAIVLAAKEKLARGRANALASARTQLGAIQANAAQPAIAGDTQAPPVHQLLGEALRLVKGALTRRAG